MVGRWGLSAGGVAGGRGGLEVQKGLDGKGGGRTGGDRSGSSGLSSAGGGGGGRGGVKGGGESTGSGFCVSVVVQLLVSGRLWVRAAALGCSVAGTVCAVAHSEITTSVIAGGSGVEALVITDEPPAAKIKKFKFKCVKSQTF